MLFLHQYAFFVLLVLMYVDFFFFSNTLQTKKVPIKVVHWQSLVRNWVNRSSWIVTTFPTLHCCAAATCHRCRSPPARPWWIGPASPRRLWGKEKSKTNSRLFYVKRCSCWTSFRRAAAGNDAWETQQTGFCALWRTDRCIKTNNAEYFPTKVLTQNFKMKKQFNRMRQLANQTVGR